MTSVEGQVHILRDLKRLRESWLALYNMSLNLHRYLKKTGVTLVLLLCLFVQFLASRTANPKCSYLKTWLVVQQATAFKPSVRCKGCFVHHIDKPMAKPADFHRTLAVMTKELTDLNTFSHLKPGKKGLQKPLMGCPDLFRITYIVTKFPLKFFLSIATGAAFAEYATNMKKIIR